MTSRLRAALRSSRSRAAFQVSSALLLFLLGALVDHYRVFPYPLLEFAKTSINQTWYSLTSLAGRPASFLQPARYAGAGVTRLVSPGVAPGLTMLTGFFDGATEVRLIQSDGTIINRWRLLAFDIFKDFSFVKPEAIVPQTNWNTEIHGAWALRDGSIVFNFDYKGTAKIDRCGTVLWTVRRVTHHSVEPAEAGGFWVPGQRYVEEQSPFPSLTPPYRDDTILHLSSDGTVLNELSVTDILFKNNLQGLLFASGRRVVEESSLELTHLNDVEELTPDMATHFPRFSPGDLLLSLRRLNLVMVVDPRTEAVKWQQVGPWIMQHDPDFQPDGTIAVFNNNSGAAGGEMLGGSTIMTANPVTDETRIEYGGTADQHMFTKIMGKAQRLDDGHRLITEAQAGRTFEVDREGRVVWEYINRYDEDEVAAITQATRYPEGYFAVTDWSCS